MDETKNSIEALAKTDPKAAIQAELAAVKADQEQSSWLRQGIDFISQPYDHQAAALQKLEEAAAQMDLSGTSSTRKGEIAAQAIKGMEDSRQGEWDAYRIVSGAVKTAVTFTPGKYGLLASGAVYALDATGSPDSAAHGSSFGDASWGFAKGLLMRGAVSQISKGNEGPALMSIKLGLASRAIDTALTPTTYADPKTGDVSWGTFGRGLLNTGKATFNPISLGTDLATAGLAQGVLALAPRQLAGNTFRAMTTMTFTRGYASGLAEEAQDEYHKGHFSLPRLAAYPLATALSQTLAAAPGNQSLQVRRYPLENAAQIRDLDFKLISISPEDVKAIARGGGLPVEATVKQIGEDLKPGESETMSISRANLPTDWLAAAFKSLKPRGSTSTEDQMRFVSRPKGDENTPWQMATNKGTSTITELIKKNSNYYQGGDVAPFLKNFAEPATRYLGSGSESGAFQLANGAVLKVGSDSMKTDQIPMWGKLPYDARTMYGPVMFDKQMNPYNRSILSTASTLLLQEPLKTPITEAQAARLREDMSKSNVWWWDYNYRLLGDQVSNAVDQAGIDANGKAVMLDYGARRGAYKNTSSLAAEQPETSNKSVTGNQSVDR